MLATIVVLLAAASAGATHYYPTRVGDTWTYRYPDADVTLTVTKVEEKDGRKVISVGEIQKDGTVTPHEKVAVSGEGLARLEQPVFTFEPGGKSEVRVVPQDPPLWLLKLPSKPGDEWDYDTPGHKLSYKAGKPEVVKLPAGEFRAVPVDVACELEGRVVIRGRYWYAPGVGAVRWTSKTDQEEAEVVLKSFTPGKK